MNLAAIIEEGKRVEQAYRDAKAWSAAEFSTADACHRFYLEHGPRLLALVEKAVEMRDAFEALDYRRTSGKRLLKVIAAFDAAASAGEGK